MVQEVGVNAFSFGALAEEIGVSAPSIHHHFRTKDDLVAEVAARYRASFAEQMAEIHSVSAGQRLGDYAQLFAETSAKELLCFCGSLASDWMSVGEKARSEVSLFFADQVAWVAAEIDTGVASEELECTDALATASVFVAALEGSMLVARARGDAQLPDTIASTMIAGLARHR